MINEDRKKKDHITQEQWNKKKEEYDKYTGSNGVYKPGCEMTDAMSKASLDNPGMYKDGKIGQLLEQYIVGLFGLTMINGLVWSYLYKYNPAIYGMDCSSNWGPKVTMPLTALSGLSYVIGDAQANVKFKMASKEATDNAFSAKSRNYVPGADSDEVEQAKKEGEQDPRIKAVLDNKAQEDSYDTLISILEAQRKAVKTKRALTTVANVGYVTATGLELANTIKCAGICATERAEKIADKATIKGLLTTLNSTLLADLKTNPVSCGSALGLSQAQVAAAVAQDSLAAGYALGEAGLTVAETTKSLNFFQKVWKGIKGLFSSAAPAATVSTQIADAYGDKLVEDATNTAIDSSKQAAELKKVTFYIKQFKTQLATFNTTVSTGCPTSKVPVDKYVALLIKYYETPIECCGGNGISLSTWIALEGTSIPIAKQNPFAEIQMNTYRARAKAKILAAADIDAALLAKVPGTMGMQGPPVKSMFVSKKDIVIGGLFGGVVDVNNPEIKEMLEDRKEFLRIVMRSGIENYVLSTYTDKLMQNPKLYIKTVAENSIKIDKLMEYFDNEILSDLNTNIATNNYDSIQESMKEFAKKVSNILVPKAHAIGGLGGAAAGGILMMVGSQIDNPWLSEVFNMGGKLMLLQGLLGKLMKNHALNRPIGRSITWPIMSALGISIGVSLKKTQRKIERNIEIVKTEKIRYMNSAAARTGLADGAKVKRNTGNLQAYDPTAAKNNSMKIKACAVPKGTGFAPAMCPAVIPKQRMSLPDVRNKLGKSMTPNFLKGMSTMSKYAYGAASGSLDGETMSESDLDALSNLSNAISADNARLRDKVDDLNSQIKTKDGSKLPSLKRTIANFKRSMGLSPTGGSGSAADGLAASEYNRGGGRLTTNNVINKGKKPTKAAAGGKVAAVKVPDLDLDFGDDDTGGITNTDSAVGTNGQRKEEKLEDFVLQHDDINKRKDIPIWKILSNRYILSYPKILEEEDAKLEPDKVQEKKK